MAEVKQVQLFIRHEIRDTLDHYSEICEWLNEEALTLFFSNTHDQALTIQVLGNKLPSRLGAISVGASFTLAANSQESRTLTLDTSGWLPYILVKAKAATAPTKGDLTVLALFKPAG